MYEYFHQSVKIVFSINVEIGSLYDQHMILCQIPKNLKRFIEIIILSFNESQMTNI